MSLRTDWELKTKIVNMEVISRMNIYFPNWDTFENERGCVLVIYSCVTNYPQNLMA